MASTPLERNAASWVMKPGRWFLWQVGVKAPGRPKRTTDLPAKKSLAWTGFGPSGATGSASRWAGLADGDGHLENPPGAVNAARGGTLSEGRDGRKGASAGSV